MLTYNSLWLPFRVKIEQGVLVPVFITQKLQSLRQHYPHFQHLQIAVKVELAPKMRFRRQRVCG